MPLYSDPAGYFYSTGGGGVGGYSSSYSSPYYTTPSSYVGSSYGRPYAIPSLSSYSSSTSSRYQPKLSTINETSLGSRGVIPLTRLNSPKIITTPSYHHHNTSKYIPPRPININTADIDVSASRYRTRDLKSSPKSPKSSPTTTITTKINESPQLPTATHQSTTTAPQLLSQSSSSSSSILPQPNITSPYMPRADGTDPTPDLNRTTIKRNRAVVRLSTLRKSIRDRSIPRPNENQGNKIENDDNKKPKIDTTPKLIKSEITIEPSIVNNSIIDSSLTSWRDKFRDDLVPKPFGIIKKSPGELLLERYIIPSSKYKDDVFVNSINVTPSAKIEIEIEKPNDENNDIIIELDPLMQSAIRRLSIPKCPDFQDFCEDISSDKIDDDLNAGELRRRASIIQEQEIELLNQLQKSASGSFQLIHLERNESGSDLTGGVGGTNRKSTKRKSLTKKPKKIRHKITATVDIQNSTLTPILQESFEDEIPSNVVIKPKFTYNVDEIEENHTIHQVFKLPKKKSIDLSPKIEEEEKQEEKEEEKVEKIKEKLNKSLEKIELKNGIKDSPKKIKITKKNDPIKGVKTSPKIEKVVKEELDEKTSNIEKIKDELSEIVTELIDKPKELAKLQLNHSKSENILNKQGSKDSGNSTPKTPIMKKKPPKSLEILKSKKIEDNNKTISPSFTTKSPIKISSPSSGKKLSSPSSSSDIYSNITPEHFKFDDDSIKRTEAQNPIISNLKSASKLPISPLAINHKKDEIITAIAKPKPIISKIQKSDSGEDFWTQIGTRDSNWYMNNRKRKELESQWDKRETLLDNQTIDEIKNLEEIKIKVHDQKNVALKQADEQNISNNELGKRSHSNESTLCAKKKGILMKKQQDLSSLDDDDKKFIKKKSEINENIIKIENEKLIKSKEIPKKIPDINDTNKKVDQPLQQLTTTPTDSEKSNNILEEKNIEDIKMNLLKIENGLNAKSPEIKCKEIDLNKNNKLDTKKIVPPSSLELKKSTPDVSTIINTNNNVATKIITTSSQPATNNNNLPSSDATGSKKTKDIKSNDEKISEKSKKKNDEINNKKISPKLSDTIIVGKTTIENGLSLLSEKHESKNENVSLQKLTTTTTSQATTAIIDKQQKKISPPTTFKTPQSPQSSSSSTPVLAKLTSKSIIITSPDDIKISSSTATTTAPTIDNKNNKKLNKELEKIGKIPDNNNNKNICDANSIDKIKENEKIIIKNNKNEEEIKENHQEENEKQQNENNKQQFEHQLSCKNVLMKFATVSNLNQCLLDVDADIEDIKTDSEEEDDDDDNNSSYSSYSSDNNKNLSESMKRKDKKNNKHKKQQQKEEKQFNRNKVKLDHTKKCYVKDEAPPYPLIATPRPLWKPEKFIIPSESDTSDDSSDTDNSDNDDDNNNNNNGSDKNNNNKKNNNGSDNNSSTSSDDNSSTDDEFDDELNPNKSSIIRMSTCSNDSGFEGGTAPSSPKKMLGADARDSPSTPPSYNPAYKIESNNDDYDETSYTYAQFQKSGRITAPATNIPRFKKYSVEDFHFLTVLGKGSFGKVLLAELRNTDYYYAVKCLKKDVVLEDDDVECTLIERKVLALGTKHPYLCHLFCTFQTESHLFFVMEYLNGGDLMFHIQQSGRFPEPRARFYAAEIISGLKFLHKKGIIYRDLKLDNVLLDFDGHVRIADFGMCKLQIYLDKTADSFCGTPDYMAPEIIKGDNYNQSVDWWSFGVLLYEMLIGQSPFSGCDEEYLFWSICNEMPLYPLMLSQESTSLLKALLEKDSNKRIGSQYSPAGDIYGHPFFNQIEWDRLEKRQIEPPFKPQVKHPLDTQYFDKTFTRERVRLTPIDKDILQSMDQAQFQGFSYTNPNATIE